MPRALSRSTGLSTFERVLSLANRRSFVSVITGTILGAIVLFVRRLKPFIVAGTLLFMAAFGILIRFRGGADSSSHSGIIGGQILLGVGK